jgi:hypothetical protein
MGETVDLSELKNLSLSPKWERVIPTVGRSDSREWNDGRRARPMSGGERRGRKFDGNFPGRDPRSNGRSFDRPHGARGGGHSADRFSRKRDGEWQKRPGFSDRRGFRPRFEPIVDVEFYPNDMVFEAICSALKSTNKTYELFTAARLFLEKPERFAMVIRKKKNDGADKNLYLTVDDNFVFATESEASAHVLSSHREKYFTVEERDVTPPTGNFTCLHRCGITGKILCPPNYHRYHEILMDHCDTFLPRVPFERFKEKIEKITDPQEIENWRAASAKAAVLTPKDCGAAGGAIELKSPMEVRKYFAENLKDKTITHYDSVRLTGETFSAMPHSPLSKSIFMAIEHEKTFPLNFANNLRGRLRRSGFTIYKIGGKSGISYISGIRRKFRAPGDVFADDIQRIISRIDANPGISVVSLCSQCAPSSAGEDFAASDKNPGADDAVFDDLDSAAEATGKELPHNYELLKNLHWLICEGYVAEFENGTLISTSIMQPQKSAAEREDAKMHRSCTDDTAAGEDVDDDAPFLRENHTGSDSPTPSYSAEEEGTTPISAVAAEDQSMDVASESS